MNQKWNGYEWWDSPNKEKENRNGDRRNAAFCILLIILGIASSSSSTPHRTHILKRMHFFLSAFEFPLENYWLPNNRRNLSFEFRWLQCDGVNKTIVFIFNRQISPQAPRTLQQIYWLNYSISFAVAENAKKNKKNCWQITESKSLILIRWLFHSLKHFAQFFNAYTRFFFVVFCVLIVVLQWRWNFLYRSWSSSLAYRHALAHSRGFVNKHITNVQIVLMYSLKAIDWVKACWSISII